MNSTTLLVAAPMTQSLIVVQLVTLLFRLSTTWIVPLLFVVAVKSILLFSNFISTVFAGHGFMVTGMIIGAIPGMFIVMVSSPALKLGYKVISSLPSLIIKSLAWLNSLCFFVLLFWVIYFSWIVHGCSSPCLLVIFATVLSIFPFLSLTVITKLGIFSGIICAILSAS
jgi:hypothetical protein